MTVVKVKPIAVGPSTAGQLWSPVVRDETMRLLLHALPDEAAREAVLEQSIDILARCRPPAQSGGAARVGLALGYVQSGKTLSFTNVTTLAHDNGYPIVVLLAGTKKNLHDQTAKRLVRDLQVQRSSGISPWFVIRSPASAGPVAEEIATQIRNFQDTSTPEFFRRTTVITIMKNPSQLTKLKEVFEAIARAGIDLADVPMLIIDDEADQAGLNASPRDEEATATYQAISRLREAVPNHTYLMYTATPQAPLLINIGDMLSPDFVKVLEPGVGYTGGKYFFVQHGEAFIRRISSHELVDALDPSAGGPTKTFLQALATYLLGVVSIKSVSSYDGPVSMLVHPSHTTELHSKYVNYAKRVLTTWSMLLKRDMADPDRAHLVAQFKVAHTDLAGHGFSDVPALEDLLEYMSYWIDNTKVREINSSAIDSDDIPWATSPSWVLVGGNKLDRGFTVEGLTVSYMPRGAGVGNSDTIQQRARFFGYKDKYAGACRVWMSYEVAQAFESYVEHEEQLRKDLAESTAQGLSLKAWGRRMLLDPALKPCRANVVSLPYVHERVPAESWVSVARVGESSASEANASLVDSIYEDASASRMRFEMDPRTGARHHTTARVPVDVLVSQLIVDWAASDDDHMTMSALSLLLRARQDKWPSLAADIVFMDDLKARERTQTPNSSNRVVLQQGASTSSEKYPGDRFMHRENVLAVQIHRIKLKDEPQAPLFHGLSIWVPAKLAGAVVMGKLA